VTSSLWGSILEENETFQGVAFSRSTTVMRKFWRSAAECLVASLALASLTVICYRLHVNIATAGLLFVIVVVILSRFGSFVSSVFAAIIAALCLAHIAPPAFSFEVGDPLDIIAIISFSVTSLVIAGLVSQVRKQAEDARSSVSYRVIEAEEQERHRIASDLHEDIGQRLTLLVLEVEQLKTDTPNPTADVPSGVDAVLQKSSEILTDVKALAHELYSPRLEYLGISGVMSSFYTDFGNRKRGRD
jgi:signal transduction histidine kinase